MKARGGGSIVNIGSINAYIGEPKLGPVFGVEGRADDADAQRRVALAPPPHPRQPDQRRLDADRGRGARQARGGATATTGWTRRSPTRPFGRLLLAARHRASRPPISPPTTARWSPALCSTSSSSRRRACRTGRRACLPLPHLRVPQVLLRRASPPARRDYLAWIREAPSRSAAKASSTTTASSAASTPADVDPIAALIADTGQTTSLLCFSPDFTHPDADERARQVRAAEGRDRPRPLRLGAPSLPHAQRAALSGHDARTTGSRAPLDGHPPSLEYAEQRGVVLCMENHYKDGTWHYPEFAQPEDIFLEIIERIDSPALRRAVRPVERRRSAASIRSRSSRR